MEPANGESSLDLAKVSFGRKCEDLQVNLSCVFHVPREFACLSRALPVACRLMVRTFGLTSAACGTNCKSCCLRAPPEPPIVQLGPPTPTLSNGLCLVKAKSGGLLIWLARATRLTCITAANRSLLSRNNCDGCVKALHLATIGHHWVFLCNLELLCKRAQFPTLCAFAKFCARGRMAHCASCRRVCHYICATKALCAN